jgi:hypothetical protein
MPYAIIRVAKITSQASATSKTEHNYRLQPERVPNADQAAPYPNQEYVNDAKKDYWTLATERIEQVVTRKVRADQVRAVEVILTASPEGFKRDADGRATDQQVSKWTGDNLRFLEERYGKENVVSFTLHQDEKTPHIHAVLVPITPDGRLSAKDLFNRESLSQLQTDYAEAMKPHGLTRGVEHSQAKHEPVRRFYGLESTTSDQVSSVAQDVAAGRAPVAQLEKLALANVQAVEQSQTLRKQLSTSEGLKQANFDQLQAKQAELTRLAVGAMQKDLTAVQALLDYGAKAREEAKTALTKHLEHVLKDKVPDQAHFLAQLRAAGYQHRALPVEQGPGSELVHELTGARFPSKEIQPNGQAIGPQLTAAIERTQRQAQAQEQTPKPTRKQGPSL